MKTLLKTIAFSLLATPILAQTGQDALRLTMLSLNGNARYASMGGAFGALGGNFSALSTNPAGIGIYRSNEFSFTPALTIGRTEARPDDARSRYSDLWNFNLGNFGLVGVYEISKSDSKNEWKMIQFGIGLNRQTDFWNRSSYTRNANYTYLDVLVDEANTTSNLEDDFYRGSAYDAGLILWDTADGGYFYSDLAPTGGLMQRQTTKTTGAINELAFSFGGNYGDFLYLGATVGVPYVNFRQDRFLRETDDDQIHPDFSEWTIQENLKVSGHGVNLKLGAIVKPTDFIRIGLAIHTPTHYALKEEFFTEIAGNTKNSTKKYKNSSEYDYIIRTPMRLIGSVGFVIGKNALISAEYEMVDYGRMLIDDLEHNYDLVNDDIAEYYRKGGTLRIGGEYRMDPVKVRLGYNYVQSPYQDNSAVDFSGHSFSVGLGFVTSGGMTIDLAYVNTMRKYKDQPYPEMPMNQYNAALHQILVTMGWRF